MSVQPFGRASAACYRCTGADFNASLLADFPTMRRRGEKDEPPAQIVGRLASLTARISIGQIWEASCNRTSEYSSLVTAVWSEVP